MRTRWIAHRERLIATGICRLGLNLRRPPLRLCIKKLHEELERAGIRFRPDCYLSNGWGCPDLVPIIGIPFYLARADLRRLHREMGYDVESPAAIMRLLRHEAGHAVCYAYRLYRRKDWQEVFGPFHKAYCDHYIPDPFSGRHVIHAKHYYAQKHPDEDFAEAFAVWLAPRSGWRRKYAGTPAFRKLIFIERLMRLMGRRMPPVRGGPKDLPIEEISYTLGEYYGESPEEHRARTEAYMDRVLKKIFPPRTRAGGRAGADAFIRARAPMLARTISFWAGIHRSKVEALLRALARRARRLKLAAPREGRHAALAELTSVVTFFVYSYVHTARFAVR